MSFIMDILGSLGEVIVGIIDFVVSFFTDLVYIVQLIGTILAQIPAFFSWLPAELSVIIVLGITVAAIYKIAGRD